MSALRREAGRGASAEVKPLRWREAVYRFAPLRNAPVSGLLLGAGLAVEWSGGPDAFAIPLFLAAIVVGAWLFAQEGFEELVEEREVGSRS